MDYVGHDDDIPKSIYGKNVEIIVHKVICRIRPVLEAYCVEMLEDQNGVEGKVVAIQG